MDQRLSQIEARIGELAQSQRAVEDRLQRIERRLELAPPAAAAAGGEAMPPPAISPGQLDFVAGLTLVGRTLLGLAGGYLLRALTSDGTLAPVVGVGAGLVYAVAWIVWGDRAGARGRTLSAAFHGVTSVLVAVPLIWETTARFGILSPPVSAAALAAVLALGLAVAWRWKLRSLAWIVSLAGGASALALAGPTAAPVPYAALALLLGMATLWLAWDRGWRVLPWVTAAVADLAVLLLWAEDPIAEKQASIAAVLVLQLGLLALYAGSLVWRALRRDRVTAFSVVQTAAAVAVGYGGALLVARPLTAGVAVLGGAGLALAVAAEIAAVAIVGREHKAGAMFLGGLAVALALLGSGVLLPRPATLWAVLAVALAWLAGHQRRFTLRLQAVPIAAAAVIASGLWALADSAWTAAAAVPWPTVTADQWLALAAVAVCLLLPARGDLGFWQRWTERLQIGLLALALVPAGGLAVKLLVPLVTGVPGAPAADPAIVATVRTAVLAVAALALASLGRTRRLRQASALVYPVLLAGAIKLLIEDFPAGKPATLFLALALYGGALILAPRLRKPPSPGADEAV